MDVNAMKNYGMDLGSNEIMIFKQEEATEEIIPISNKDGSPKLFPGGILFSPVGNNQFEGKNISELPDNPGNDEQYMESIKNSLCNCGSNFLKFLKNILGSVLFRNLREFLEIQGKEKVEICMGTPYIIPADSLSTIREAAGDSGIELKTIWDPAAIFMSYHQENNFEAGTRLLILDMGHGNTVAYSALWEGGAGGLTLKGSFRMSTSFFSVSTIVDNILTNLRSEYRAEGNIRDQVIQSLFDKKMRSKIRKGLQELSRRIGRINEVIIYVPSSLQGTMLPDYEYILSGGSLLQIGSNYFSGLLNFLNHCKKNLGGNWDKVLLSGGIMGIPACREKLIESLKKVKLPVDIPEVSFHPGEAVARGALLADVKRLKVKSGWWVGVEYKKGDFLKLLPFKMEDERTEAEDEFSESYFARAFSLGKVQQARVQPNQVVIKIFVGSSNQARDNHPIGSISLELAGDGRDKSPILLSGKLEKNNSVKNTYILKTTLNNKSLEAPYNKDFEFTL